MQIPASLFRAFLLMAPRARARRELEMHRAVTAAQLKPADRRRYRADLERRANGGRRVRPIKATAADMAALGIQREEVPT